MSPLADASGSEEHERHRGEEAHDRRQDDCAKHPSRKVERRPDGGDDLYEKPGNNSVRGGDPEHMPLTKLGHEAQQVAVIFQLMIYRDLGIHCAHPVD